MHTYNSLFLHGTVIHVMEWEWKWVTQRILYYYYFLNVSLGGVLDKWTECYFISKVVAQEANEAKYAEQKTSAQGQRDGWPAARPHSIPHP